MISALPLTVRTSGFPLFFIFFTYSVVFQGASGLAEDNSNFFWEETNHRLGIGTTTPLVALDVQGAGNITGDINVGGNAGIVGALEVTGASSLAALSTSGLAALNSAEITNDVAVGGALSVTGATTVASIANSGSYIQSGIDANTITGTTTFSNPTYSALFTGGNVGIGTNTPAYSLTVGSGDLFGVNSSGAIAAATGITSSGNIDFASLNAGGLVKAGATTGRLSVATAGTDYENPLTFGNGMTRTANAVALGGTLTENTTITNGGFNFNITGAGNVGIGTSSPNEQLELTGNLRLPTSTANTGLIKSGANVLIHNFGTANFFAGVDAGNLTLSGESNTGVGVGAMRNVTTGYLNNFFGSTAGSSNTVGNQNNFFGSNAGFSNVSAGANNFFGNFAGYLTTGGSNSFFGHQAGYNNSTGSGIVAFGRSSGISNTTGTNNTFIGFNTGSASTGTLTNATAIGYNAQVTASNSLILGNGANVGIGTTTPTSKIQVVGTGTFGAAGVSALNLSAHTATLTASPATFRAAEIGAMTLSASSAQTVTTASSLYVNTPVAGSNVTITNNKPIDTATTAYLSSGGTWTNASSRARKENFVALDPQEVLDKIDNLSIERWNYKAEDSSITHIGPVAEEFYAAFNTGGIEGDKSISTIDPAGVALLGIQGLSAKVKTLLNFSWVIEAFKNFGVVIEQNIIKIRSLAVEKLQIGSADKPSGFVMYDEDTQEAYCVKIKSGEFIKTKGDCSDNSAAPLSEDAVQAPTEQAAPETNPEPAQTQETAPHVPVPSESQDTASVAQ